jgi:hypothetical protein
MHSLISVSSMFTSEPCDWLPIIRHLISFISPLDSQRRLGSVDRSIQGHRRKHIDASVAQADHRRPEIVAAELETVTPAFVHWTKRSFSAVIVSPCSRQCEGLPALWATSFDPQFIMKIVEPMPPFHLHASDIGLDTARCRACI